MPMKLTGLPTRAEMTAAARQQKFFDLPLPDGRTIGMLPADGLQLEGLALDHVLDTVMLNGKALRDCTRAEAEEIAEFYDAFSEAWMIWATVVAPAEPTHH